MAITIQFTLADDLTLMESLLRLFREAGVQVQVVAQQAPRSSKPRQRKPNGGRLAEQLHGVVKLPTGFDYKSAMAEDLLKKHAAPLSANP